MVACVKIGLLPGNWTQETLILRVYILCSERSSHMKKKQFTEEQIMFSLRQEESGIQAGEVCRKMGVSEATFYR